MKKTTRFLFIFTLICFSTFSTIYYANAQITETQANESIREVLTSGVYTSGNLNFNVDTSSFDSNTKFEYGKQVGNLIEFRTGNSIQSENGIDRIAFLTFNVDINIGTTYNVEDACSTFYSQSKSLNYMDIHTFQEYWTGVNYDDSYHNYDINYKDYTISVKRDLGIDGNIPIDVSFDTSDFIPTETILDDGSMFETTGLYSEIDSINVYESKLSFIDGSNALYQTVPLETMPKNKVSDLNEEDYKNEEDAPSDYRELSLKVVDAGLTGFETFSYATTSGTTGHKAQLYCQNGELDEVAGRYMLNAKVEPQVQVRQQTLQYKQMNSDTTEFHNAGRFIYLDLTDAKESDESRHAVATLSTETFTRNIGAEVYNVNLHASMSIIVKIIATTVYTKPIEISDVSDSEIQDEIDFVEGDMYWDNALNQEVGEYILDTSSWLDNLEDLLGFNFSTILWVGGILIFIIFILPVLTPIITSVLNIYSMNKQNRRRR